MALVLDTSAILTLADARARGHAPTRKVLEGDRGPYVVPAGILAEAAYMLESRIGPRAGATFVENLARRELLLDCAEADFARIAELLGRYVDLPLGFADAAVVACAERRGRRVLTADRRDFDVVAGDVALEILP